MLSIAEVTHRDALGYFFTIVDCELLQSIGQKGDVKMKNVSFAP